MYIAEHHKTQELGFSKPFQVHSQMNTSSAKDFLILQEASKPSQVSPELIPALYFKRQKSWTIQTLSCIF